MESVLDSHRLLLAILRQLPLKDVLACRRVCKNWASHITSDRWWGSYPCTDLWGAFPYKAFCALAIERRALLDASQYDMPLHHFVRHVEDAKLALALREGILTLQQLSSVGNPNYLRAIFETPRGEDAIRRGVLTVEQLVALPTAWQIRTLFLPDVYSAFLEGIISLGDVASRISRWDLCRLVEERIRQRRRRKRLRLIESHLPSQ